MSWEVPLIKFGLDGIIKALTSLKKKGQDHKQKAALSTVVSELLKIDPDITTAEAQIAAMEAVGTKPSPEMLRAKQMLAAAKVHHGRKAKKAAKRAAPRKRARKRAARRARRGKR